MISAGLEITEDTQVGIYCIVNKLDGKSYVGSSVQIPIRTYNHRRYLRLGEHNNNYLQSAWNKYGEENFEFKIVELCEAGQLSKLEEFYLQFTQAKDGLGYNMSTNTLRDPEHFAMMVKLSSEERCVPVRQFDLEGNFIAEYESMKAAEAATGVSRSNIGSCLGARVRFSAGGFLWTRDGAPPTLGRIQKYYKKQIEQLDMNGNSIAIFDSLSDASRSLRCSEGSVSMVTRGVRNSCGGFKFRYI